MTKRNIQIGKEDAKLPLFLDDIIMYVENWKEFTGKLSELVNKFTTVGHNVNI